MNSKNRDLIDRLQTSASWTTPEEVSSVETGQMSAVETGQMSAAEKGHLYQVVQDSVCSLSIKLRFLELIPEHNRGRLAQTGADRGRPAQSPDMVSSTPKQTLPIHAQRLG